MKSSNFQLSVITDEISQDFDHALDVAQQFNIEAVEVRSLWNKNIVFLTDEELNQMKMALDQHNMKLSVVCSPFAKCFLPGNLMSNSNSKSLSRNPTFNLSFFDRIVHLADYFQTKYIRIFNFLRLNIKINNSEWQLMIDTLKPFIEKAEISEKILLLENENRTFADRIARTAQFFEEIQSNAIKLNLDPGNFGAAKDGITPDAYETFYERDLVAHMHVKDIIHQFPFVGAMYGTVGKGIINYPNLFKQALDHSYTGFFSLETHALRNKEAHSVQSLKNISEMLQKLA
jgi:sugar phosphate isomerase/epimerase